MSSTSKAGPTMASPKYFVSGASGFVGRMLVQRLVDSERKVVAIGRSIDHLRRLFPNAVDICTYEDWHSKADLGDVFVHLAARNTSSGGPYELYEQDNVDFTLDLMSQCQEVGIRRFLFASSIHALDPTNLSHYAESKRQAERAPLSEFEGVDVEVRHLAAIYGDRQWPMKLQPLNLSPRWTHPALATLFGALRPLCHIDLVYDWVVGSGGSNVVGLRDDLEENAVYRAWRRGSSLAVGVGVLAFLGWLLGILWLAIRLTSPGPGLFAQQRIGRGEVGFTCYKFRTMRKGTRVAATHLVSSANVTRIGAGLRRLKLDELPQAINLLSGDMVLVGPRPGLPIQDELLDERRQRGIFAAPPGITGLAQIHGVDMSSPARLAEWDASYLANRGILYDVSLMVATVRGAGRGDRTRGTAPRQPRESTSIPTTGESRAT